jgi:hypothetical protein
MADSYDASLLLEIFMTVDKATAVISKVPQRGALQVIIIPTTTVISAGANFSIAVTIINPFDIPITVGDVSTILPIDLYDIALESTIRKKMQARRKLESIRKDFLHQIDKDSAAKTYSEEGLLRSYLNFVLRTIPILPLPFETLRDGTPTAVARVSKSEAGQEAPKQYAAQAAKLLAKPELIQQEGLSDEEIEKRVEALLGPLEEQFAEQSAREIDQPVILQPGDSVSKVFTLRTKRRVWFIPASYQLNIQISYEADEVKHSQTMPYSLDIQSSIGAVIIGAAIGSLFGVLANNTSISSWSWKAISAEFLSALIISAFTVIAFARKEGVQPVIAIQDIWGGLLIGFLIGYTGPEVFGTLFDNPNSTVSPVPASE